MMVRTVGRIFLDVAQGVIHPAHVPLEPKAKTAAICRRANSAPTRRFFCDHHDAGVATVCGCIHFLHEPNGVKIFTPTKLVRQPLVVLA